MRRKSIFFLLLVFFLLPSVVSAAIAKNVAPAEAFDLVKGKEDVFLLDVRTFGEYQQARLQGAQLIPIDQLVKRLQELPVNKPILVYCAVGSRSAQVVNYLARRGYPELYNLYGGIYAWAQKGYPVLQGAP